MIHAVDGDDVREWRDLDDLLPDDVSAADQAGSDLQALRGEARVMHQVTTPHEDQLLLTVAASAGDTALAAEVLELRATTEQLRRALASRAVIDQARGMVMALTPCSSARAWDLLVDVSQHCNVKRGRGRGPGRHGEGRGAPGAAAAGAAPSAAACSRRRPAVTPGTPGGRHRELRAQPSGAFVQAGRRTLLLCNPSVALKHRPVSPVLSQLSTREDFYGARRLPVGTISAWRRS